MQNVLALELLRNDNALQMSAARKVLVTGGAGFIGSHICNYLKNDYRVLAIDDLSTGKRENLPSGVEFRQLDICSRSAIDGVFDEFKPDIVSHHAAQTSVSLSVRKPERDATVNILGGLNVLQAALRTGVERFVFASTGGAMYGEVEEGEAADVDVAPNPISPYACSKLSFETYLRGLTVGTSLSWSILRYANVYGPRQDPHGEAGVVAIFARRLLAGEPLSLYALESPGDGGCIRDYVFVDDVVRIHGEACKGGLDMRVNNLATGRATSTLEIAQHLAATLEIPLTVNDSEPRPGDLMRSVLKPNALGLVPEVSLETGLRRTASWFRDSGD